MSDLCTPWCVHVVATLGIAGLAAAAKRDPHVLDCVLGHLVSKGVFEEP